MAAESARAHDARPLQRQKWAWVTGWNARSNVNRRTASEGGPYTSKNSLAPVRASM